MEDLCQYVLSVIVAALLCGIIPGFFQKSTSQELIRLVCGIVLTITVIAPILGYDFSIPEDLSLAFSEKSESAVSEGEEMSNSAMADIIKAELEAYVLDKAAEMNAEISIEIRLSEETPPVPVSAVIHGTLSPSVRQKLQKVLTSQLEIAKENQQWIG